MSTRFGLPNLGIGVGLRSVHYPFILEQRPRVAWFEVLSDNYMQTRGRPLEFLERVAEHYPIALHGVGLSIGSSDPLDLGYLLELRALRDRFRARWVSDHLAWTGVSGGHAHELFPVPFTTESLAHVVERVQRVQDFMGAPLVLENPSTYLEFAQSTLPEHEFIAELCHRADCGLLLDVNNLYVNAHNHGFDPHAYLRALPLERVVQFHVAGHSEADGYLADTHSGKVIDPVWALLGEALELGANAAILLEWDADIPSFPVVHREALRAERVIARSRACARAS